MKEIQIEKRKIGEKYPPFIIAEMSGNHGGKLSRALEIVDAVAETGADALKLQTYTADTMTIDMREREFFISDPKSLWKGHSLYDLYKMAYTPWQWHKPIFERCRKKGLIAFSTPFDSTAVDFLSSLNVPAYKIASFENVDLELIRRVSHEKKPVIISTGMASGAEIKDAVVAARQAGCKNLILLKCTSAYPAAASESNLRTIPHMSKRFGCMVGLSDHSLGTAASILSLGYGAVVIERHVVLSRKQGGVDAAFSLEPDELKKMVRDCKVAWEAKGSIHYGPTVTEKTSLVYRRSLYAVRNIGKGEKLTRFNIRSIRPGLGLAPKFLTRLLDRPAKRAIAKGTPLKWDMI